MFPVRRALRPGGLRLGRRRAIGVGFGYSRSSGGRRRGWTASSPQASVRKPARLMRFARERLPGAAAARASHSDCKGCCAARPPPPRCSRRRCGRTAGRCWRRARLLRRSSGASAPQSQCRRAAWPCSAGFSPRERARCIGRMRPALLAVSFARRRLRWSPPAAGTDPPGRPDDRNHPARVDRGRRAAACPRAADHAAHSRLRCRDRTDRAGHARDPGRAPARRAGTRFRAPGRPGRRGLQASTAVQHAADPDHVGDRRGAREGARPRRRRRRLPREAIPQRGAASPG